MSEAHPPHACAGTPFPTTPQIIFANWREALEQSGRSSGIRTVYALAVPGTACSMVRVDG